MGLGSSHIACLPVS